MGHRLARAAAVAAAVLLAGNPGTAYLTIRDDSTGEAILWKLATPAANVVGGKVTFYVDEASAIDVTPSEFGGAVRAAVASWGAAPGAAIAFDEDPARAATQKSASDRVNRIGFSPGLLGPGVLGKTYTYWSGTRILDTDVVLNPDLGGGGFGWSTEFPGDVMKADVEGVVAHEWGHAVGLAHSALQRSTMYFSAPFGGVSLRTLERDDLAGLAHAYPAPDLASDFATIRGTVDVAGAFDDRGIQVTAVETVGGLPAASVFTAPDGSYAIEGLPPGAYRVIASPIGTLYLQGLVYNSGFWDAAITEVLPSVLTGDGSPGSPASTLVLAAGQVAEDVDLVVAQAIAPGEPDNGIGAATPVDPGTCVAARMESGSDIDFYSFSGVQGLAVTVLVHAGQIGSRMDPRIYLRDADGFLVPGTGSETDDISAVATSAVGRDYDSRIREFTLPETGTYYVQVESVNSVDPSRLEDFFYVLTLLVGQGDPSAATSAFSAAPPVLSAGGGGTTLLTFRPRAVDGVSIGPGWAVTMEIASDGDTDGALSAVTDEGDGTYTATLGAAALEGNDTVAAKVDGVAVSSVVVDFLGGCDFAASEFRAEPRRIRFDGAETTTLVFVPRDAHGVAFGPGRTVDLSEAADNAAMIGPTGDAGDGSYEATLTSGIVPEMASVAAEVDGVAVTGSWGAEVGFPVDAVVDDGIADIADALAADPPPLPRGAARLVKARKALLAAALLVEPDDTRKILAKALAALKQLEAAAKKGEPMDATARELVEALREKALNAIHEAAPDIDTNSEVRSFDRAETALALGDLYLADGLRAKAGARFLAAWKHASKIR